MQHLNEVLLEMTAPRDCSDLAAMKEPELENLMLSNDVIYSAAHKELDTQFGQHLQPFLKANMDEIRLFYAEKYATEILKTTDYDDAKYFRMGVMRRELAGDMDYDKQRDHAAHTLNNYLLGWFIFSKCKVVMDVFREHLSRRELIGSTSGTTGLLVMRFREIWYIASLVHDVGYIFEGALRSLDTSGIVKARKGAEYINDYFQSLFWEEVKFSACEFRDRIGVLTGVTPHFIDGTSLGTISDSLRSVGSLDYLWKAVQGKFDGTKSLNTPVGDAFSLWHENFKNFGMNQMAQRISKLEIAHNFLLREGLPKVGIRMIDHGIAGGMLLLLCSTQYFRMHFGLLDASFSDSEIDKQIKIQFDSRKDNPSWEYDAAWWWKAVVWATAAVAMHNVQTMTSWPGCDRQSMKLAVSDDPLTYLGVLVDTLQDWDRYTSSRDSIFTEKLPVSSTNMKLGDENGIAILDYGDADVAEKIRADLSKILVDWEKIIKILPAKKI